MKRVSILITLLILTACIAVESPTPSPSPTTTATLIPSATVTPSATLIPSATVTPSATPTPTVTLTPSNTPPPTDTPTITATPEFHNPNPGGDIFFTPYDDEDCQLPCWQGLRIGESTIDDVQIMFDRVFNLDTPPESFETIQEDSPGKFEVAGTKIVLYWWELPGDEGYGGYFEIVVVVDAETDILQGLHISQFQGDGSVLAILPPKQVIEAEGTPDYIVVSSAVEDHAVITLAYRKGMFIVYSFHATIFEEENRLKSTFCINDPRTSSFYVVSPFEDIVNEPLDRIHEVWRTWFPQGKSSEIVLGLSAEEIGEMALQSDNPCFTIEE